MYLTLRRVSVVALAVFSGGLLAAPAEEPSLRVTDPMMRPALISPRAARATLLDVALAGKRLVAVGERGIVLLSDDNGANWHQASVPVSVTLTVVRFADEARGWAAGHNGVLLRTTDGGESWERILDGGDVVRLYQHQADQLAAASGEEDMRVKRARRQANLLASDGPDKPWLDLNIDAAGRLWLVGAYGLVLRSRDGLDWEAWSTHLDNPGELHLYAMRSQGEEIVIAGEQGLLLRSEDGGESFKRLQSPYKGSYFVLELHEGQILVAGLRGNAFLSTDHGEHFKPVALPAPISVTASVQRSDGVTVLADQAGNLYQMAQQELVALEASAGPGPSALVEDEGGGLVSVGRLGPQVISLPTRP